MNYHKNNFKYESHIIIILKSIYFRLRDNIDLILSLPLTLIIDCAEFSY